jgi:hypothetical protein
VPRRNDNTYPVTEIVAASKLKILLGEEEDFLVVRRTEKEILVSGLQDYMERITRREKRTT